MGVWLSSPKYLTGLPVGHPRHQEGEDVETRARPFPGKEGAPPTRRAA